MEIAPKLAIEEAAVISENLLLETSASALTIDYILKDLAAGSLAGVANVVSGHPFDTIKVRMQMIQTRLSSCIKSMIAREGMSSFYKGVYSPLYSLPAINAVVFGSYEFARRTLAKNSGSDMTITQGMLAGSWAGLLNCLIVTPVELVKCRQQMEGMGRKNSPTGTWALMSQIARKEGITGLYKGNLITVLREVPAYAIQFGSYEVVKNSLASKYGPSSFVNFFAGGIAGFVCWAVSYPQDVIKTKLQCDFGTNGKSYFAKRFISDGGIINCAQDIYRHEGFRGFWRGFSACTIRAAIANAFTFVAYEEAKKLFI